MGDGDGGRSRWLMTSSTKALYMATSKEARKKLHDRLASSKTMPARARNVGEAEAWAEAGVEGSGSEGALEVWLLEMAAGDGAAEGCRVVSRANGLETGGVTDRGPWSSPRPIRPKVHVA